MKSSSLLHRSWLVVLPLLAACAPAPQPVSSAKPFPSAAPAVATRVRETPPPPGPVVETPLPRPTWSKLANGLTFGTLPLPGLPLVDLRVTIAGGRSGETKPFGAADVLGEVLQQSVVEIESLGAQLELEVGDDALVLRVSVPASELEPTLAHVAKALKNPKLEKNAVEKIRRKVAADAVSSLSEESPAAAASMLRRALFSAPTGWHPYARSGVIPGELDDLTFEAVRAYHEQNVIPSKIALLVAGAIDSTSTSKLIDKLFSDLKGKPVSSVAQEAMTESAARRVMVVHVPKSDRSVVFVGYFGPRPTDGDAVAFAVLHQLLGRKGTGRLFLDLRENRSLAYTARTFEWKFARAPQVFAAYVNTQPAKTDAAVGALLDNLERVGKDVPTVEEVQVARAATRGALTENIETTGDIADLVANLQLMGLPSEHWDRQLRGIEAVTPEAIRAVAAKYLRPGRETIVVAGDADELAPRLVKFGAVEVVDAMKGFAVLRRL